MLFVIVFGILGAVLFCGFAIDFLRRLPLIFVDGLKELFGEFFAVCAANWQTVLLLSVAVILIFIGLMTGSGKKTSRNFKSEKHFEHYGAFRPAHGGSEIHGIYFENGETGFNDNSRHEKLTACIGKQARLKDSSTERKTENPPRLYNLNAAQKDAFRHFGYSADKTLKIIQSLYEELKCISYPKTPSRVMGSGNVDLCRKIFRRLIGSGQLEPSFSDRLKKVLSASDISLKNKRVFNDSKLKAHHAIIPLKALPENAGEEQKDIYWMIYNRFTLAFLPPCEYEKQTCILQAGGYSFKITGKRITNSGYKDFETCWDENEETEKPEQSLENIDWSSLVLSSVETKEK